MTPTVSQQSNYMMSHERIKIQKRLNFSPIARICFIRSLFKTFSFVYIYYLFLFENKSEWLTIEM